MGNKDTDFTIIGEIIAPWGIRGKMKVSILTDFPERFRPREIVYIDGKPMAIESTEWSKGNAIIKIKGIDDIDTVESMTGKNVEINSAQEHKLSEGQYYHYQITGLKVITITGKLLGTVSNVLTTSGTDIYAVNSKEGEILIPATADVIKSIDIVKKEMIIEAIPGLLELNQKTPAKPKQEKPAKPSNKRNK